MREENLAIRFIACIELDEGWGFRGGGYYCCAFLGGSEEEEVIGLTVSYLPTCTCFQRNESSNNKKRAITRNDPTMTSMSATVSGMAASIRAATDNETFDLAGHDVSPDLMSLIYCFCILHF